MLMLRAVRFALCTAACALLLPLLTAQAEAQSICQGQAVTGGCKVNGDLGPCQGTSGPDVIIGTPGADVIHARGGNDQVVGRGGADVICGGSGNDLVRAGGGSDSIEGNGGDDDLRGEGGPDTIDGGGGSGDVVTGGNGNDACIDPGSATFRQCEFFDEDGDGFAENMDCNDADPAISPIAAEFCNGIDEDCDSIADNDVDCSDGIACTVDSCDGVFGCFSAPDDLLCDDGNADTADMCDAATGCVHVRIPRCGDGIPDPAQGEMCDDGNLEDGDGCTSSCENEAPADCAGVGGASVAGLEGCFFLGNHGESCTSVCEGRGLQYSELTRTEVGSGTDHFLPLPGDFNRVSTPTCTAALQALGAPMPKDCNGLPARQFASSALSSGDNAVGCVLSDLKEAFGQDWCQGAEFPGVFRGWISWLSVSNVETTADGISPVQAARVCACR